MTSKRIIIFASFIVLYFFIYFCFINLEDTSKNTLPNDLKEKLSTKQNTISSSENELVIDKQATKITTVDKTNESKTEVSEIPNINLLQPAKSQKNINDKKEIEIHLIDGESNADLKNTPILIEILKDEKIVTFEKQISNNNGVISFKTKNLNIQNLTIAARGYVKHHLKNLSLPTIGLNKYEAKLYKGGSIEVKATNKEGNRIANLEAVLYYGNETILHPSTFNPKTGIYLLTDVPLGYQGVFFKAKGYHDTPTYSIRITSKELTKLEIQLDLPRIITIELDCPKKPAFIIGYRNKIENNIYMFKDELITNSLPSSTNCQFGPPPDYTKNLVKIIANKNENDLYEITINSNRINTIQFDFEEYVSKYITIDQKINYYKLKLEKIYNGSIKVLNEKDEPAKNAKIWFSPTSFTEIEGEKFDYSDYPDNSKVILSDENGFAQINNLKANMDILIQIELEDEDYSYSNHEWKYREAENQSIIIRLKSKIKNTNSVMGIIKSGGNAVNEAKISLYTKSGECYSTTTSGQDGRFAINYYQPIESNTNDFYLIANHPEYGVSKSPYFHFDNKPLNLDLNLIKEKSLNLKIMDSNNTPFSNEKIFLLIGGNYRNATTDINGEAVLFNLTHGEFKVLLNNNIYKIKNSDNIIIPSEKVTLIVEKKELTKLNISLSNSSSYKGKFDIFIAEENQKFPKKLIPLIDTAGNIFLNLKENDLSDYKDKVIFYISAIDYAIAKAGPFNLNDEYPESIDIKLTAGESLKILVTEAKTFLPIKNILIEAYIGHIRIGILPTNNLGEVDFKNLTGKINISIKPENHAEYLNEIDLAEKNFLEINLIKGGSLIGKWKKGNKNEFITFGLFGKIYKNVYIFYDNFEIKNLNPDEYRINYIKSDDKSIITHKSFENKIIIEEGKTIEIDIDELIKKSAESK